MRISDWSSDLCSSDLGGIEGADSAVTIAASAGEAPLEHRALQVPVRLHRDRLEAERIHEALDTDVHQLDIAVGDGQDPDAKEADLPEKPRQVRVVAGEPVQRFHDENVEQIGRASCRERVCQYV